jgi:heterodisulfide reductase subunit C
VVEPQGTVGVGYDAGRSGRWNVRAAVLGHVVKPADPGEEQITAKSTSFDWSFHIGGRYALGGSSPAPGTPFRVPELTRHSRSGADEARTMTARNFIFSRHSRLRARVLLVQHPAAHRVHGHRGRLREPHGPPGEAPLEPADDRHLPVEDPARPAAARDARAGCSGVSWVLTAGTAEIMARGVWPGFSYAAILPAPLYALYTLSQELFALLVLGAVSVLLYRRLVVKPRRLQGDKVHSGDRDLHPRDDRRPDGHAAPGLSPSRASSIRRASARSARWRTPCRGGSPGCRSPRRTGGSRSTSGCTPSSSLYFLNYLPYSKHLHVIVSLPNVYLSNTSGPGQKGVMRAMNLEAEDAEQFGAADVTHLTWKNLLDGYSCTECGRCTAACPANITGKVLSPRKVMVNTRQRLMELAPLAVGDADEASHHRLDRGEGDDAGSPTAVAAIDNRLLDNYITEEELWACTSCRACVQDVPVAIDQLDIINELRRNLVLMESRFPPEVQPAFESLESNGSPWAFSPADRANWAEGLTSRRWPSSWPAASGRTSCFGWGAWVVRRPLEEDHGRVRAHPQGSRDQLRHPRAGGVVQRRPGPAAGERVPVPDARQGRRSSTLDRYEVKTIVTICPHCFHQIGNEFPQLAAITRSSTTRRTSHACSEQALCRCDTRTGSACAWPTTTRATWAATTTSTTRPRETLRRALPVMTLVEPPRTRTAACVAAPAAAGCSWRSGSAAGSTSSAPTELLATGRGRDRRRLPVLHDDGDRRREPPRAPRCRCTNISEVVASRIAEEAPAPLAASGD